MTKEQQIEDSLIAKLSDLKYTYREDIKDRETLERNFREKFQALNRVNLTDSEFMRLRDEIVNADVHYPLITNQKTVFALRFSNNVSFYIFAFLMSKNNLKYNKPAKELKQKAGILKPEYPVWLKHVLLAGILILTFWCYRYSLNNQFLSWDDSIYVYQNPLIENLSLHNMKMLLQDTRTGNFHPITMLSLALNWHYAGANPESYYATEIIMHLLNTILVFFLSLALFNAMVKKGYGEIKGIPYLAALCALLHGIHPMHVESVSWLAERKDVLYLFFYLLGLIAYVKYVMENKNTQFALVILLYFLSLLSKPMAVVFPFSLLAIDVLLKRKIEWRLLIEKLPLFLFSIVFIYLTYKLQRKLGYIAAFHTFTAFQRILFAGYDYLMYLIKLFVPANLSALYPYPDIKNIPLYFYLAPFAAISITIGLLYFAYKKGENYFRVALFGFGFYFFNIVLVLQFVSAGPAVMADRYSYASYFGLTFMLVYFIYALINKIPAFKTPVVVIIVIFSCLLTYLCQARTKFWHNSETLWTDVIKKYPHKQVVGYVTLGNYYFDRFEHTNSDIDRDKASDNYIESIKLGSDDSTIYCDMGIIMQKKEKYDSAVYYYTKSLKINDNDITTYIDRSTVYLLMRKYELAINDVKAALKLQPNSETPLRYLAWTYINAQQFDSAIYYYNRLLQINPTNPDYFHYRGAAEFDKGEIKPAIDDFIKNLSISPNDSECMFFLSKAYNSMDDFNNAYKYAQMAKNAKFPVPDIYMSLLKEELGIK